MMTKQQIRSLAIKTRANISAIERHAMSKQIAHNISKLDDYKQAQKIALYYATSNEVDLKPLWDLANSENKEIYFPKLTPQKTLIFASVQADTKFIPNKFAILEPSNTQIISITQLDLIILPIVAFDAHNNRLGMGCGYYDRTLNTQHTAKLVGVAYQCQYYPNIPIDTWDIPLDFIITEQTIT